MVATVFVVDVAVLVACTDAFTETASVVVALVDVAFDSLVVVALGASTRESGVGVSVFEKKKSQDAMRRRVVTETKISAIIAFCIPLFYSFFAQSSHRLLGDLDFCHKSTDTRTVQHVS